MTRTSNFALTQSMTNKKVKYNYLVGLGSILVWYGYDTATIRYGVKLQWFRDVEIAISK